MSTSLPLTLQAYNLHLFPPIVQFPAHFRGEIAVKDDKLRRKEIGRRLLQTSADFVALSEVWYGKYKDKLISQLKSIYPYSFNPDLDPKILKGKFLGSGLLLLSKFPLKAKFTLFQDLAGDDNLSQKGFITATCKISPTLQVGIFSTHIQAGYEDNPHTEERLSNISQIVKAIQRYQQRHPKNPIFFLGDLNISDSSPEYQTLNQQMTSLGLEDLGTQPTVGNGNTLQLVFSKRESTQRIDYIFAPKNSIEWIYTQPKRLPPDLLRLSFRDSYLYNQAEDLSDHYPVLIRVQLPYRPPNQLQLKIVRAKHLPKMDWFSNSDPYVKLEMGDQSFQTSTKPNQLSPIWNETFILYQPFKTLLL